MSYLKRLFVIWVTLIIFVIPVSGKKIHDARNTTNLNQNKPEPLKITILYDNYIYTKGTKPDWGFACFIEGPKKTILFDTGTKSEILFHNTDLLNVDLRMVDTVVISHNHHDHTGGLFAFLKKKKGVTVYLPVSFPETFVQKVKMAGSRVVKVKEPMKLCENVFFSGEMGDLIKEQALIISTPKGTVVVNGCAHPGIVRIVKKAKEIVNKKIFFVFGGFHLMRHSENEVKKVISQFRNLGVLKVGATHCTGDKAIQLFKDAYGKNYINMGVGKVITIPSKN